MDFSECIDSTQQQEGSLYYDNVTGEMVIICTVCCTKVENPKYCVFTRMCNSCYLRNKLKSRDNYFIECNCTKKRKL